MCDYSLQTVTSRPAKVADRLVVHSFGTGTTGFKAVDDQQGTPTAVCVLPGTEIAFDEPPTRDSWFSPRKIKHKVAIFRQINKETERAHHDALEFSNGETILLTALEPGKTATVLQLPAAPKNESEAKEQTRLEIVG